MNKIMELIKAVAHGKVAEAQRLLEAGAVDDARDSDGRQALHHAAMYGEFEIAQMLLENGADVNSGDNNGWTALHYAAFGGHVHVVALLLQFDAEPMQCNDNGNLPLHYCRSNLAGILLEPATAKGKRRCMLSFLHASTQNYL